MAEIKANPIYIENKVNEMKQYKTENIVFYIEDSYKMLAMQLSEEKGIFINELFIALEREKQAVMNFIKSIEDTYQLVGESTKKFKETDESSANSFK